MNGEEFLDLLIGLACITLAIGVVLAVVEGGKR